MDGGRVNFLGILYQLLATGAELVQFKSGGRSEREEFEGYVFPEFYGADNALVSSGRLKLQQMKCSGAASPPEFRRDEFVEIIKSASKTLVDGGERAIDVSVYELVTNRPLGVIEEYIRHRDETPTWFDSSVPDFLKKKTRENDTPGNGDKRRPRQGQTFKPWLKTILGAKADDDPALISAHLFLTVLQAERKDFAVHEEGLFDWFRSYGLDRNEAAQRIFNLVGELAHLSASGGGRVTRALLASKITGTSEGQALTLDQLGKLMHEVVRLWAVQNGDSCIGELPLKHFVPDFWDEALSQILPGAQTATISEFLSDEQPKRSFLFHAKGGRGKSTGLIYLSGKLLAQGHIVIPVQLTSYSTSDINRAIDERIKSIAKWSGVQDRMLHRLLIANQSETVILVFDGLNEKVESSNGMEYAKAIEESVASLCKCKVLMSLRSNEGGRGPDPHELPLTEIMEVSLIPLNGCLKMLGIAPREEIYSTHLQKNSVVKEPWPTMTEPLLFSILSQMDPSEARKAVLSDGDERQRAIQELCSRVASRANKRLNAGLEDETIQRLLAVLIRKATSSACAGTLLTSFAKQKASDFGLDEKFIQEIVQLGFFDRSGDTLVVRYMAESHHLKYWSDQQLATTSAPDSLNDQLEVSDQQVESKKQGCWSRILGLLLRFWERMQEVFRK